MGAAVVLRSRWAVQPACLPLGGLFAVGVGFYQWMISLIIIIFKGSSGKAPS